MPRLNLTAPQRTQLNEWLNGGPTDPTGINGWIATHCPNAEGVRDAACTEQEGERDLYQFLLDKDAANANVTRNQLSTNMVASLGYVAGGLDWAESNGLPIGVSQQMMRTLWNVLRNL